MWNADTNVTRVPPCLCSTVGFIQPKRNFRNITSAAVKSHRTGWILLLLKMLKILLFTECGQNWFRVWWMMASATTVRNVGVNTSRKYRKQQSSKWWNDTIIIQFQGELCDLDLLFHHFYWAKIYLHPKLVVSINAHNCIILLKIRTRIGRSDACQPQLVVAHTQLSTICNHNHQNQQAINSWILEFCRKTNPMCSCAAAASTATFIVPRPRVALMRFPSKAFSSYLSAMFWN